MGCGYCARGAHSKLPPQSFARFGPNLLINVLERPHFTSPPSSLRAGSGGLVSRVISTLIKVIGRYNYSYRIYNPTYYSKSPDPPSGVVSKAPGACWSGKRLPTAAQHSTAQRAQYPIIKAYSLNHTRKPYII